jgi:hypothetical protein
MRYEARSAVIAATGESVLPTESKLRHIRLSRRLFRAAGSRGAPEGQSLGEVLEGLGDRSFGWLVLIFSLANLMPLPPGSTLVLAIPLLLITAQMAMGLRRVRLPGFITRRRVDRKGFQRIVLRLRPLIRPIEKVVRARHEYVFAPGPERALGAFLLVVSTALFLPIPLSGYLPAIALFITGFGLVERDGLVTLGGVAVGMVAIIVTIVVGGMIFFGARAIAN